MLMMDMTPTAKPTPSDATRKCHSTCSWNEVITPTTGEPMPTMAPSSSSLYVIRFCLASVSDRS
jgi:hypothetical protein